MLEPLYAFASIFALGIGAEWLASRLGVPSILVLLIVGFLAGPVTGLIEPDVLLGDTLFPIVSLAVAVILFEGGMNLRFAELKPVRTPVLLLTTLGVAVTWGATSLAAWWLLGFAIEVAFLLGATLVVTGPTVVTPLLRNLEVDERLETVATWEGIVNDPIGAVLTVSVYELAVAPGAGPGIGDAVEHGYSEARQLDAEVFFVIAGSVVFSSAFAGVILKSVGLDD